MSFQSALTGWEHRAESPHTASRLLSCAQEYRRNALVTNREQHKHLKAVGLVWLKLWSLLLQFQTASLGP